jgi:hypothetical protein
MTWLRRRARARSTPVRLALEGGIRVRKDVSMRGTHDAAVKDYIERRMSRTASPNFQVEMNAHRKRTRHCHRAPQRRACST